MATPDPETWVDAQRVADEKRPRREEAWVDWGVAVDADAAQLLERAQALLKAADRAATAAGQAAERATAAVDAAIAAAAAKEAETKKIEAWKNAAQAIALAREVTAA